MFTKRIFELPIAKIVSLHARAKLKKIIVGLIFKLIFELLHFSNTLTQQTV